MNRSSFSWPLLVLALLCLVPVYGGVRLLSAESEASQIMGWALIGFFGSGTVVLTRKAITPQ